jgi:hypothetical protein
MHTIIAANAYTHSIQNKTIDTTSKKLGSLCIASSDHYSRNQNPTTQYHQRPTTKNTIPSAIATTTHHHSSPHHRSLRSPGDEE